MRRALLLFALALPVSAQHVTNPTASVVDVPARIAELSTTKDPLLLAAIHGLSSCVSTPVIPAPPFPMRIPHHYLKGSNGPTNPAEKLAAQTYYDFETRITSGMNQYLATGSHAEAQCTLDQLDLWAKANAITDYDANDADNRQAWFQAEWTLCSAGVTVTVLVNDKQLDSAEQKRVLTWLNRAAHKLIGYEKPGAEGNNHHYWRALAATSIGIATHDNALYSFGVDTFKQAIAQLDTNGAFPLEMARHENAIHYQGFAIEPLLVIAQLASRQGTDLFTYAANGHTIRNAVTFYAHAVDDPTLVKPYTTDAQRTHFAGGDFAPFRFYTNRFGTEELGKSLPTGLTKPTTSTRIGGSTTLLAGK